MGFILEETPEMGEYSGEVRQESFYLQGEPTIRTDAEWDAGEREPLHVPRRHGISLYKNGDTNQGTIEILIEDIPKIRAVLDAVETYHKYNDQFPNGRPENMQPKSGAILPEDVNF